MPSPQGVFVGLSQVELDALRVTFLAQIQGGQRTSLSGGGKSGSKAYPFSPQEGLQEVIYAERASGARAARVQKVTQVLDEDRTIGGPGWPIL